VTLQPESNRQVLQQRLTWLYYPVVILFVVLAARLWQLQIIRGSEYAVLAERNRVRTIQVVAPRGTILDRNSRPLVENRPSFNVLLYREAMEDRASTFGFIVDKLSVRAEELEARLRRSKGTGLYRPVVIKEDVGIDDISIVEAHQREHPEIQLGPEPRRLYRYGQLAAHVLGYVGEISEDELAQKALANVHVGDVVGKAGVERTFNSVLTGVDGSRQVLVDSLGREVEALETIDSVVGGEVWLTIDLDLQSTAESLLYDKVGVILAMDPRDGELLAMASSPSYDPNSFSTRISEDDWNRLINDPNRPLQNRAIHNAYPPGSIFKLVMAEAGLEEGLVQEDTRVSCTGSALYYNRLFHCHNKNGHGTVDAEHAIEWSCNIFFYELGRRLGISKIAERATELGLGEKTGVDLPGERAGVMPSPEWKQRTRNSKWFAGETISVSIGQGAVTTTPLQVLRAISALATGGTLVVPRTVLRTERPPDFQAEQSPRRLNLKPETVSKIRAGMWASVNSGGTGHNAQIPGLDVCGKTGTVQVMSTEKRKEIQKDLAELEDHSWFAGFAPRDNPEIVVVAFIEHGGKGGIAAAPLAREIFRVHFEGKNRRGPLITQFVPAGRELLR
jgi:penicillin-binding protein 2